MKNFRDKIQKVSVQLMSSNGYHGTSIQMIADKAGCSKATIFHHFNNKEGILLSVIERNVIAAVSGVTVIVQDKNMSGQQKLENFIRYHLHIVKEEGDVLNLYLRESKYLSKTSKKIHKKTQRDYVNLVEKIIQQVIKEQQIFKNVSSRVIAYAILGMCNGVNNWFNNKGKLGIDEIADYFIQILVGSL